MLLLQIKNSVKNKKLSLLHNIYISKKFKNKLIEKKSIIENFNTTKNLIKTDFFHNLNSIETVKYIVGLSFFKKNTIIYIIDMNGRLKYQCSAGFIKLNKNQKTKMPLVLIKLTKILLFKMSHLNKIPVAIHLNNMPRSLQYFFEFIFKTQFLIVQLTSFQTFPHNGCRPKKLKRKKRKNFYFN
jgi:ribosomal protein S11